MELICDSLETAPCDETYRIFRKSHRDLHRELWQLIERRDSGHCWRWLGDHGPDGYAVYTFHHDGCVHIIHPHRYLYYALYDKLPVIVGHRCGNNWCCNINHLVALPASVVRS
jgi:hypothetical protein